MDLLSSVWSGLPSPGTMEVDENGDGREDGGGQDVSEQTGSAVASASPNTEQARASSSSVSSTPLSSPSCADNSGSQASRTPAPRTFADNEEYAKAFQEHFARLVASGASPNAAAAATIHALGMGPNQSTTQSARESERHHRNGGEDRTNDGDNNDDEEMSVADDHVSDDEADTSIMAPIAAPTSTAASSSQSDQGTVANTATSLANSAEAGQPFNPSMNDSDTTMSAPVPPSSSSNKSAEPAEARSLPQPVTEPIRPVPEPEDPPISGSVASIEEFKSLVAAVDGSIETLRPLIRRVGAVFSDPFHLIAIFRTGDEEPDLAKAVEMFEVLASVEDEEGLVDNALRNALQSLASQLGYPYTRSNKRRIIVPLVALEYEAFQYDPDMLGTESHLLKSLIKGSPVARAHLRWFLRNRCSNEYLSRLVTQTQMYITLAATMGADSGARVNYAYLEEGVLLLRELHEANESAKVRFIDDYTEFYNSAVNELATEDSLFLRDDLRAWLEDHFDATGQPLDSGRRNSFCDNSFMLDPGSKARLLQLEARVQQYSHAAALQTRHGIPVRSPSSFRIRIRRESLVDDVMNVIARSSPEDFKRSLRVEFVGEEGVDEGGVQKEFFLLMVRQLLDPNFGMFSMDEDSRKLWFNPNTFEPKIKFELVGIILGLAIYNGVILDLTFPRAMYKKLLGVEPTLSDLEDLSPQLAKGLKELLKFNGDVEATFCRNFQVSYDAFGEVKTVDLVPGGGEKPVTNDNREEYVQLYVDYYFNRSVEHLFQPFRKGFYDVCENTLLRLFKPDEMELLLCGNTSDKLDFADLQATCRYEGYTPESPQIKMFWEVVKEFSEEQKKRFLQFTTGSDRVPIRGLRALQLTISKNSNSTQLPTSSTCFNYLILPEYTSQEQLKQKLLLAIDHAEGFGTM